MARQGGEEGDAPGVSRWSTENTHSQIETIYKTTISKQGKASLTHLGVNRLQQAQRARGPQWHLPGPWRHQLHRARALPARMVQPFARERSARRQPLKRLLRILQRFRSVAARAAIVVVRADGACAVAATRRGGIVRCRSSSSSRSSSVAASF